MPIFAYSENIPNAKICIIKYPNFDIMTELRGTLVLNGATLMMISGLFSVLKEKMKY